MNGLKTAIIGSSIVSLMACTGSVFIEPKQVKLDAENVCTNPDKSAFDPIAWLGGYLIKKGAEFLVEEVTEQAKKQVQNHTATYKLNHSFACDFSAKGSRTITFNIQDSTDKRNIGQLQTEMSSVKNNEFTLAMNTSFSDFDWSKFKTKSDDKIDASVVVNLIWKVNTRKNGEILHQPLFDGAFSAFKLKEVNDGFLINNEKKDQFFSSTKVTHPHIAVESDSDFVQVHSFEWSITMVDESLDAEIKRKVYDALEGKEDDHQSKIEEWLKEEL
ncbi:hypothetical protein MACH09_44300 [Vibrio sp. MACH09]|uniref:hypothetical protein n=1 Tax=unclassified Vibrio TaxID=2614977 RepID=UPI0014939CA3|nr:MULTISPECIES: hypothetical protein [unclassified Vibrio]NOI68030.1 hypothetical protein [Vibrio sp. 99-8-1]GLO63922.1 hypothetical protein MACH09_44300 [Vibrio sp. MACH09]